jgi:hypothetical protein
MLYVVREQSENIAKVTSAGKRNKHRQSEIERGEEEHEGVNSSTAERKEREKRRTFAQQHPVRLPTLRPSPSIPQSDVWRAKTSEESEINEKLAKFQVDQTRAG